jgi:hypothetical protein
MTIRIRIEKLEQTFPARVPSHGRAKQRLRDLLDQIVSDGTPRLQKRQAPLNDVEALDLHDTLSPAGKLQAFLDGQTGLTERSDEP